MSDYGKTFDAVRPYVNRAIGDEEVRRNVTRAWKAARRVYHDLSGEDAVGVASRFSRDDSVREGLDTTVQSLSEALVRMSGKPRKRSASWTPVVVFAVGIFVLFNPATGASTRKWIKDHLFGSEEEYDYSTPNY
jgi:hypothetical protein